MSWTTTDEQVETATEAHQLFNRVPFPPACSCGERMPDGNVRDRFNEHMAEVATTEKAAEALWRASQEVNGFSEESWEGVSEPQRASWRHQARAVLVAVGPMIAAQALRDAAETWAENPDSVDSETPADTRNWMRDRADTIEKEAGR